MSKFFILTNSDSDDREIVFLEEKFLISKRTFIVNNKNIVHAKLSSDNFLYKIFRFGAIDEIIFFADRMVVKKNHSSSWGKLFCILFIMIGDCVIDLREESKILCKFQNDEIIRHKIYQVRIREAINKEEYLYLGNILKFFEVLDVDEDEKYIVLRTNSLDADSKAILLHALKSIISRYIFNCNIYLL